MGAAVALGLLLPSCYGLPLPAQRAAGPVTLAFDFAEREPAGRLLLGSRPAVTLGEQARDRGTVPVRGFHEPGDWAHRNYCGAGATQVLLSAWLSGVPDIETVARRARLDPNRGEYGADAVVAINAFLDPVAVPALGRSRYRAEHVATLAEVKARIRADIVDPEATRLFGHGVPVMVQAMTRTMPSWNRWNATHMITIFAFDFSHDDPAQDTVTYAETPSPLAGYRGPDFQTISLSALWTAMQAYNLDSPLDPMNMIW